MKTNEIFPLLIVAFLLTFNAPLQAQSGTEIAAADVSTHLATKVDDTKPEARNAIFPGGQLAMKAYMKEVIEYPDAAESYRVGGRVLVRANISSTGEVESAEVVRGIFTPCDAEALRAVRQMPRWEPAHNGLGGGPLQGADRCLFLRSN